VLKLVVGEDDDGGEGSLTGLMGEGLLDETLLISRLLFPFPEKILSTPAYHHKNSGSGNTRWLCNKNSARENQAATSNVLIDKACSTILRASENFLRAANTRLN
jgi:hypothetical protein